MANFQSTPMLCFFLLLAVFDTITPAFSQQPSAQNFQAFYPLIKLPNMATPTPAPSGLTRGAAVGMAVAVTFAGTLVLSGLVLFLLLCFWRRTRDKVIGVGAADGGRNNVMPLNDGIALAPAPARVKGNLKGVIVEENGVEVLYWRNSEDVGSGARFERQIYRNFKEEIQDLPFRKTEEAPPLSNSRDSSLEGAAAAPPIPPPPPLTQSLPADVRAITPPKPSPSKPHAPPPPPIKRHAPPPPPPPRTSALPKPPRNVSPPCSPEIKLKPLHWEKVKPDSEHSMVWDKIDKGSFRFDSDLMEALFGTVAMNNGQSSSPVAGKTGPPSQIFILEPRKSQNTAIVLKSLGATRKEIIDALAEGEGLNTDAIEKLARIAPTQEEISHLLAFDGDHTRLADAESFLYRILKAVPSAFTRFSAMMFRTTYESDVSHVRESFQSIESACKELRTRGLFLKLLEAVLKAGNRLNAGTSRGNAQAFNLTALKKLSDVKSCDGKTTLLQFVVQEVVRSEGKRCVLNRNRSLLRQSSNSASPGFNDDTEREYMILGLPIVGGLSSEFSNVRKAATLDHDALVKTISSLATQLSELRQIVEPC